MQTAVRRLADGFLRAGSVKALAEALSQAQNAGPAQRIYPNRVHGMLSDDPARSVNSATLEAIEQGLDTVERTIPARPGNPEGAIRKALAAAHAGTGDGEAAVGRVVKELGVPAAVVRLVAETGQPAEVDPPGSISASSPDWSWQEDAIAASLKSLRKNPTSKVGLVVPTGGGKTRIALRLILTWLSERPQPDRVVLWVTHRRGLRLQARRTLQQLLRDPVHAPEGAASLFAERIRFVMVGDLSKAMAEFGEQIGLVVIDEAHHAAAPSYEPIFADAVAPALFLTATPNRSDDLPIGIDEIAYTITYRELFARGCVIEPVFDPPLDLTALDWSASDGLRDLADYLLERTEEDFGKVLVAVSLQDRARTLYEAVSDLLDERPTHPLSGEDVGYVHGAGNSAGARDSADFLDEFKARPKGILIATSQLIGEGYDDPSIDAVVVTYPSTSIGHLMQVAGRALRWAPGKRTAHVVQVRESNLEYHFDQRWLYQDISDRLRPDLVDMTYGTAPDLRDHVDELLERHNVAAPTRQRVLAQLDQLEPGEDLHLMLTGIPHYGTADEFAEQSVWGAVLIDAVERQRFIRVFNDVSARNEDIKEHGQYLCAFVSPDSRSGSLWKSYVDLIVAAEYARKEITQTPYYGQELRPYRPGRSTTWLRYITLKFAPTLPLNLERFLRDAVNREAIAAAYLEDAQRWAAAARIELPLVGAEAFLLDQQQAEWLRLQLEVLVGHLQRAAPEAGFAEIAAWQNALISAPLPLKIIEQVGQFFRPERFESQYLNLADHGRG
ncbi:DEAD/DEAH box helicase [Micromonospora parathelypteridis]|uniref:Superfamily II DNA or RNA helicase n=1 Tax=Micromonospora parathelypteridis TaxID=1839617 RepID=A0A840W4P1_9ACTN|nr:DEAD/DEAH box helicase family protein [Micromonospora parathelypteridis]MBB5478101.1 superfamily II DNA or RNA helicase [Micromonospora parathelypteridis]